MRGPLLTRYMKKGKKMSFELSVGIFLVTILISRIISERALRTLTSEHKSSLIDAFSSLRAYGLIPIIVILVIYYLLLQNSNLESRILFIGYLIALFVYAVANFWYTQKRLSTLGLPVNYLKQYGIARTVQYLGLGILLVSLLTDAV